MDNMNTQQPVNKENNKLIIIIAACVIAALVAVFVIVGVSSGWFGVKNGNNKVAESTKSGQIPKEIKVVKTTGSDSATKKLDVSIRDIKFGSSIKKVKAFEKKQDDTINSASQSDETKDGYTYLTYTFTDKAKIFGVRTADSQHGSLLQYVFKDKKLFDIRIQYGDIKAASQKKVRKALKDKYGKPTSYIKYSNGSFRDSWRTSAKKVDNETILAYNYSPEMGVVVTHEKVGR